ncbi:hypothetical protein [Agriterribacter sp.]|uniref:hypothetical protein n=1 Tax=Agriterribacter sp. TaxID=2821509 RepID=UPI002C2E7A4B|nr:hypothetical protein [Agriterribacter sp.]HTN07039.1 hypothetical protein [Agriterribacter sp.]
MDNKLITLLQNYLSIDLHDPLDEKELLLRIQKKISELIENNFRGLINILYRIDVSEQKLKQLLQENGDEDAAAIIAGLIVERQKEKIKSRYDTKYFDNPDDTEDKW